MSRQRRSQNGDETAEAAAEQAETGSSSFDDGPEYKGTVPQPTDTEPTPQDSSFNAGYEAARRDMETDRRHLRESILLSCVRGIRIPVKDWESPGAVALRVVDIVEKIMLRAQEKGLIAPAAKQGEQFKQYEGAEQLNVANPE